MPKFKPVRDLNKARCIRLKQNVEIGGEWRGGDSGSTRAFYPSEEPNFRFERKAGTLVIGLVDGDVLYEVETPLDNIRAITHSVCKAEPEDEPEPK